ncbi:FAD-dependent oxidoreductase [Myxococcus sp. MxC21-1]|uniref:FAD-dependent oxidoreductase n=1 Tax=Myxococcus sp. MxC21-1 TaxID=3041439 RepID=UPI0029301512|nr:FAD-dependent oxidoreductase [Myxococcus sp. MxC21-1]WNZ62126.1 FAD-dependent oxidoreductase [Myxococcus sp. MxC21-1]
MRSESVALSRVVSEADVPPPPSRAARLRALATETFDVLIIGGGVTGAGSARDAALRGLKVALVERDDFASGTSSRSSRLIHGGLRYLEHGHLGLVFESSIERQRLLRLAPHRCARSPSSGPCTRAPACPAGSSTRASCSTTPSPSSGT